MMARRTRSGRSGSGGAGLRAALMFKLVSKCVSFCVFMGCLFGVCVMYMVLMLLV